MKLSQFKKLSDQQKRVAIAEDTLKHIYTGKLVPTSGTFVDDGIAYSADNDSVQKLFRSQEKCEVCALGSLFLSYVDVANRCKVKDFSSSDGDGAYIMRRLSSFFDKRQLALIEAAFEAGSGMVGNAEEFELSETEFNIASEFGSRLLDKINFLDHFDNISEDDAILVAICVNIIQNKGIFNPRALYVREVRRELKDLSDLRAKTAPKEELELV
jgi:hypothetical protein